MAQEVKGLEIDLTLNAKAFTQQIKQLKNQLRTLETTANNIDKAMKFDPGNSWDYMSEKMKDLELQSKEYETVIRSLKETLEAGFAMNRDLTDPNMAKAAAELASMENLAKKVADQYEALKARMNSMSQEAINSYATINAEVRQLDRSLKETTQISDNLQTALRLDPDSFVTTEDAMRALEKASEQTLQEIELLTRQMKMLDDAGVDHTTKEFSDLAVKAAKLKDSLKTLAEQQEKLKNLESDKQYEALSKSIEKCADESASFARAYEALGRTDPRMFTRAMEQLDKGIQECETSLKQLNEELRRLESTPGGKESDRYKELAKRVGDTSDKLAELKQRKKDITSATDEEKEALKNSEKAYEDTTQKIDAMTVAMGMLLARALREVGRRFAELAKSVYSAGASFETALSGLAAITGKSNGSVEIQALADKFEELANNSTYSADQVARNAQVLANAGYSISQISVALDPIQKLAIGTGEDFSTMASIVVDGLQAFGMSANEAEHFANALAKTAVSSNTNVAQLGEAFQYAGTIAGSFGYRIEEVGVALGAMAANGIKGSTAGTALRQVLTRLSANTSHALDAFKALGGAFYDEYGRALPLIDVLNSLRSSLSGLSDAERSAAEYTIAGQRGLTALNAIVEMSEEDFKDLTEAVMDSTGQVERMAGTRLDTMEGSVELAKRAWEDLERELYDGVEPQLKRLAESTKDLFNSKEFRNALKQLSRTATKALQNILNILKQYGPRLNEMLAALTGVGKVMATVFVSGKITKGIKNMAGTMTTLINGFNAIKAGTLGFSSMFGVIGAGVTVVTALVSAFEAFEGVRQAAFESAHPELMELISDVDNLHNSITEMTEGMWDSGKASVAQMDSANALVDELKECVDENGKVKEGYEDRVDFIINKLASAYGIEIELIDGVIQGYNEQIEAIDELIKKQAEMKLRSDLFDQMQQSGKAAMEAASNYHKAYSEFDKSIDQIVNNINDTLTNTATAADQNKFLTSLGSSLEQWHGMSAEEQKKWVTDNESTWGQYQKDSKNALDQTIVDYEEALRTKQRLQDQYDALNTGGMDAYLKAYKQFLNEVTTAGMTEQEQRELLIREYNDLLAKSLETDSGSEKQALATLGESVKQQLIDLGYDIEANPLEVIWDPEASKTNGEDAMKASLEGQGQSYLEWKRNQLVQMQEDGTELGTTLADNMQSSAEQSLATSDSGSWWDKFVTWFMGDSTQTSDAVNTAVSDLHNTIEPQLEQNGADEAEAYTGAMTDSTQTGMDTVKTTAETGAQSASDAVSGVLNEKNGHDAGANWIQGIINGIVEWMGKLQTVANQAASVVPDTNASVQQIESPSKVAMEQGRYWMEGLALGIEEGIPSLQKTVQSVGSTVNRSIEGSLNYGSSAVNGLNNYVNRAYVANQGINNRLDTLIGNTGEPYQTNVQVVLEGDAAGVFRIVRQQNKSFKKATGKSAF